MMMFVIQPGLRTDCVREIVLLSTSSRRILYQEQEEKICR